MVYPIEYKRQHSAPVQYLNAAVYRTLTIVPPHGLQQIIVYPRDGYAGLIWRRQREALWLRLTVSTAKKATSTTSGALNYFPVSAVLTRAGGPECSCVFAHLAFDEEAATPTRIQAGHSVKLNSARWDVVGRYKGNPAVTR
jgi:hypothetical protein